MTRSTPRPLHWVLALTMLLFASAAAAAPRAPAEPAAQTPADVPEALRPWIPWVLQPLSDRACPYVHASSSERRCAWPSQLELELTDERGSFAQRWQLYAKGVVPLPGDPRRWPQDVEVDGQPAVVVNQGERPAVELGPGAHRITGAFLWDSMPEKLSVPAETGLLALKLRGKPESFPRRDNDGTLWLQKKVEAASEQNLLDVVVHRKLTDAIPLRMTTEISLHVAGKSREELLGKALLPDFVAMEVASELPARLEPDGRVRVQVRPGRGRSASSRATPATCRASPWPATRGRGRAKRCGCSNRGPSCAASSSRGWCRSTRNRRSCPTRGARSRRSAPAPARRCN
ncbi:hypothetical protein [Nannocystis pusilla]|uniref:hypothetical protein n=1 Tax=Nannocystis pusilla TaxID=889268 RepID=UPI003B7C6D77